MRVIFIVTSFWAYGELLIAKQFAEELLQKGHYVFFIVPPTHKKNIENSGFPHATLIPKNRKFNRIIFTEINHRVCPDLVILSDFLNYNFADKHYGIQREDLDIFRCKLATFDNFDWKYPRKCMDTYGFVSDIPKRINLDEYGERILPCPILSPTTNEKDTGYRYSILNDKIDCSEDRVRELKIKNGLSHLKNQKIILVSMAKWQKSCVEKKTVEDFIKLSDCLFEELIKDIANEHVVICVGEKNTNLESHKNIIMMESVVPEKFEEYIAIADLYLGKNITSTSMIKIALSGIPCVNIINSITSKEKVELTTKEQNILELFESADLYKYMMFPVGWYYFLKPILESNLYGELIQCCEQFKMEETRAKINELLYSVEARKQIQERCNKLNSSLKMLLTPTDIVQRIVK